jgi:hypothetical protein
MAFDSPTIQAFSLNLELLTNVEALLSLACIVPLLSIVKNLIKLAQARDVFVIDLVQVIKLTQVELHEMLLDPLLLSNMIHLHLSRLLRKVSMKQFE